MTRLVLKTSSSEAALDLVPCHEMIGYPRIVGFDGAAERLKERREGAARDRRSQSGRRSRHRAKSSPPRRRATISRAPRASPGRLRSRRGKDRSQGRASSRRPGARRPSSGRARGFRVRSRSRNRRFAGKLVSTLTMARSFGARSSRAFGMSLWPIRSCISGRSDSNRSAGMRPAPSCTASSAEALEPAPRGPVEDLAERARLRIDHDQRSRHPVSSLVRQ